MMDHENETKDKWLSRATDLIESYRSLIAIRMVEHTSLGISLSIIGVLCLILAVFVLLFTGLGSALWLGEYLKDWKLGFFIVGGFYTLVFTIILLLSPKVLLPRIRNRVIKKMYEQD